MRAICHTCRCSCPTSTTCTAGRRRTSRMSPAGGLARGALWCVWNKCFQQTHGALDAGHGQRAWHSAGCACAGSGEGEAAMSGGRLAARMRARRQSGAPEQAARAPKRNPQARALAAPPRPPAHQAHAPRGRRARQRRGRAALSHLCDVAVAGEGGQRALQRPTRPRGAAQGPACSAGARRCAPCPCQP